MSQYKQLNEKQKEIVDIILNKIDSKNKNCYYIDGPGESGETFVYTTICHLAKFRNKRVCTMAFTGIAATLLPAGKTVYKTFGLPVLLFSDSTSAIKIQSKEAIYLKETDIFIWDKAPMAPRYALEIMVRTLHDIMNLPFGEKIVILEDDFRQFLPVKIHATRSEIINLSIKCSSIWKYLKKFSLIQNMRLLPEETEFAKYYYSPNGYKQLLIYIRHIIFKKVERMTRSTLTKCRHSETRAATANAERLLRRQRWRNRDNLRKKKAKSNSKIKKLRIKLIITKMQAKNFGSELLSLNLNRELLSRH